MRSHDLATLAQVTVRTLRHYHRVGVLPEPERSRNGYRDYTVHHLVRLLRIKRLAALGIPLERMPAMLDVDDTNDSAGQAALLAQLDADIDAQIIRLQAQKALINLIQANEGAADFPPQLARAMAVFATSGSSPAMTRMDRDQVILLAHLVGEQGMDRLVELYDRLAEPDIQTHALRVTAGFDTLPPDASESVIEGFVTDFVGLLAPVITELSVSPGVAFRDESEATALLAAYQADALNPAQRAVLERIETRLEAKRP